MKIWQWDDRKSITLTRYVVVLAILASAVAAVCGPWLVTWLMDTDVYKRQDVVRGK